MLTNPKEHFSTKAGVKLGFSTGTLRKLFSMTECLEFLRKQEIEYVELGQTLDFAQNGWVKKNLKAEDLSPFQYVSAHAPKIKYGKNQPTENVFHSFRTINQFRKLDLIVFHPDLIEDFAVLRDLNIPIAFENMDARKESFKTPEELNELATKAGSGVVLDLNHIYTNDPTMKTAAHFWNLLRSKIVEVHISGYKTLHDPLFKTNQISILEALGSKDIPVIVESWLAQPEELKQEKNYILQKIKDLGL